MPNELYVIHVNSELLRTTRGRSHWSRKKTWAFATEAAAKGQAKDIEGAEVVRYIPADECQSEGNE